MQGSPVLLPSRTILPPGSHQSEGAHRVQAKYQTNESELGGIILRGNLEYVVDRPRRVDGNKEPHTEPQLRLLAE